MSNNDHKIDSMRCLFDTPCLIFTVSCYYLCLMTLSKSW